MPPTQEGPPIPGSWSGPLPGPQVSFPPGKGKVVLSEGLASSKCGGCQGEGTADRCSQVTDPWPPHPLSHPLMWADESYRRLRCGLGWSLRSPSDISYDLTPCEAQAWTRVRGRGRACPAFGQLGPRTRARQPRPALCRARGTAGGAPGWGGRGGRPRPSPGPARMRSIPFQSWVVTPCDAQRAPALGR